MSEVTTELAMEANDKTMQIARLKAENDRLREERDMYSDFSCNVGRYVGLRQGEYWERTENSNYYCGGCGWKVTDHESYCPECGGALHNATLGSCNCSDNCTNGERTETCEADETDLIPFVRADSDDFKVDYIHVMECTECGHVYEHVNGDYEYCPRCGRKREDVSE